MNECTPDGSDGHKEFVDLKQVNRACLWSDRFKSLRLCG